MGGANAATQSSDSYSRSLTADERQQLYNAALGNILGSQASLGVPGYVDPKYQGLSDGDYQRLQDDTLKGYTTGLDYSKSVDSKAMNEDLARRGIWSSGIAEQAQNDLNQKYAGEYAKAGANATQARLQAQLQDQQGLNQFNLTNAQNQFSAGWQPLNYLNSVWNGTAGNKAASNSSSFSGGFNVLKLA